MPYSLEVSLNGKLISLDKDFPDPFLVSELYISWWDVFKGLFRKKMIIMWKIDADPVTIMKVMRLDRLEMPQKSCPEDQEQSFP